MENKETLSPVSSVASSKLGRLLARHRMTSVAAAGASLEEYVETLCFLSAAWDCAQLIPEANEDLSITELHANDIKISATLRQATLQKTMAEVSVKGMTAAKETLASNAQEYTGKLHQRFQDLKRELLVAHHPQASFAFGSAVPENRDDVVRLLNFIRLLATERQRHKAIDTAVLECDLQWQHLMQTAVGTRSRRALHDQNERRLFLEPFRVAVDAAHHAMVHLLLTYLFHLEATKSVQRPQKSSKSFQYFLYVARNLPYRVEPFRLENMRKTQRSYMELPPYTPTFDPVGTLSSVGKSVDPPNGITVSPSRANRSGSPQREVSPLSRAELAPTPVVVGRYRSLSPPKVFRERDGKSLNAYVADHLTKLAATAAAQKLFCKGMLSTPLLVEWYSTVEENMPPGIIMETLRTNVHQALSVSRSRQLAAKRLPQHDWGRPPVNSSSRTSEDIFLVRQKKREQLRELADKELVLAMTKTTVSGPPPTVASKVAVYTWRLINAGLVVDPPPCLDRSSYAEPNQLSPDRFRSQSLSAVPEFSSMSVCDETECEAAAAAVLSTITTPDPYKSEGDVRRITAVFAEDAVDPTPAVSFAQLSTIEHVPSVVTAARTGITVLRPHPSSLGLPTPSGVDGNSEDLSVKRTVSHFGKSLNRSLGSASRVAPLLTGAVAVGRILKFFRQTVARRVKRRHRHELFLEATYEPTRLLAAARKDASRKLYEEFRGQFCWPALPSLKEFEDNGPDAYHVIQRSEAVNAASTIQRNWRSFLVCRRFVRLRFLRRRLRWENRAAQRIATWWKIVLPERKMFRKFLAFEFAQRKRMRNRLRHQSEAFENALALLSRIGRGFRARLNLSVEFLKSEFDRKVAAVKAAIWKLEAVRDLAKMKQRRWEEKRVMAAFETQNVAATNIQRIFRGHIGRKIAATARRTALLDRTIAARRAARLVQRGWRLKRARIARDVRHAERAEEERIHKARELWEVARRRVRGFMLVCLLRRHLRIQLAERRKELHAARKRRRTMRVAERLRQRMQTVTEAYISRLCDQGWGEEEYQHAGDVSRSLLQHRMKWTRKRIDVSACIPRLQILKSFFGNATDATLGPQTFLVEGSATALQCSVQHMSEQRARSVSPNDTATARTTAESTVRRPDVDDEEIGQLALPRVTLRPLGELVFGSLLPKSQPLVDNDDDDEEACETVATPYPTFQGTFDEEPVTCIPSSTLQGPGYRLAELARRLVDFSRIEEEERELPPEAEAYTSLPPINVAVLAAAPASVLYFFSVTCTARARAYALMSARPLPPEPMETTLPAYIAFKQEANVVMLETLLERQGLTLVAADGGSYATQYRSVNPPLAPLPNKMSPGRIFPLNLYAAPYCKWQNATTVLREIVDLGMKWLCRLADKLPLEAVIHTDDIPSFDKTQSLGALLFSHLSVYLRTENPTQMNAALVDNLNAITHSPVASQLRYAAKLESASMLPARILVAGAVDMLLGLPHCTRVDAAKSFLAWQFGSCTPLHNPSCENDEAKAQSLPDLPVPSPTRSDSPLGLDDYSSMAEAKTLTEKQERFSWNAATHFVFALECLAGTTVVSDWVGVKVSEKLATAARGGFMTAKNITTGAALDESCEGDAVLILLAALVGPTLLRCDFAFRCLGNRSEEQPEDSEDDISSVSRTSEEVDVEEEQGDISTTITEEAYRSSPPPRPESHLGHYDDQPEVFLSTSTEEKTPR